MIVLVIVLFVLVLFVFVLFVFVLFFLFARFGREWVCSLLGGSFPDFYRGNLSDIREIRRLFYSDRTIIIDRMKPVDFLRVRAVFPEGDRRVFDGG